jgi:diphthine-ammonia ligase
MSDHDPLQTRCAISWSAGKDSWLALARAREQGLAVGTFVTMCDEDGASKSHALPPDLVAAQVRALGGTPICVRVPSGEYAVCFDACLRELAAGGHTHMVFGDIDLQAHRDWLAPACERAGLVPLFPLWGESRAALARELVSRGVRARVVCVDTRWLDASFCGADYDAAFLARLPAGVCPCGEDGEFHTFVAGGPGFAVPLAVGDGPQRRVASQAPFAPTEFVFQELFLASAAPPDR